MRKLQNIYFRRPIDLGENSAIVPSNEVEVDQTTGNFYLVDNADPIRSIKSVTKISCYFFIDSPVLELIVSPKLSSREDPGNITVMCVVKPFEEGFLVPYSWLVIKRSHKQIKKVQKFPLKEGVYNLTLSLTKQDFGNETSLTIVCQGSMLTHSCSNVSRTIVLSGLPSISSLFLTFLSLSLIFRIFLYCYKIDQAEYIPLVYVPSLF